MSLSLEAYFFPQISISANSQFERGGEGYDAEKCHFEGTLEFEGTDRIRGNFLFSIDSEGDETTPYDIRIHSFAAFDIDVELSAEAIPYLEVFNRQIEVLKRSATGMIYGALRELIASTSGRQPWGPFMAPTLILSTANVELVLSEELKALQGSLTSIHNERKQTKQLTSEKPAPKAVKKRAKSPTGASKKKS